MRTFDFKVVRNEPGVTPAGTNTTWELVGRVLNTSPVTVRIDTANQVGSSVLVVFETWAAKMSKDEIEYLHQKAMKVADVMGLLRRVA